jgi:hypothetical protein
MKLFERDTYNDVLERLIEDVQELNEETKKEIEFSITEINNCKYITHEKLAKNWDSDEISNNMVRTCSK